MERTGIAKLNNENYDSWKLEVEFLLVREGLWKYVSPGVKPEPAADGANAAEIAAWEEADQRARATIGLLLSRSQHGHIRNTTTAKAVWDNLKQQHEKKTLTSKVQLLKRICDLQYHEGDDIVEHLQEYEDLFEKLANAGTKLDNDLQVILVFRSLPSSFDALTTTLENRSEDDLTLELVKGKIVNEVLKRKEKTPAEGIAMKAEDKKKNIVCHHCQKAGHKKRFCKLLTKKNKEESARSQSESDRKAEKAKLAKSEEEVFAFGVSDSAVSNSVDGWIIDSGASSHMCTNKGYFQSLDTLRDDTPKSVTVADGKSADVKGIGICKLRCYGQDSKVKQIVLSEVLYVPDLDMNLVSVSKLVQKGATVTFSETGCTISRGSRIAAVAPRYMGLYHLRLAEQAGAAMEQSCGKHCVHEWHRKLGHRDVQAIREMENKQLATGIKVGSCSSNITCETCLQGKMTRLPFPKKAKIKSKAVLDLVHSDLCGPMNTVTPGGHRYFLTLIDDFSRYTTLYFLHKKSETVEAIKDFVRCMKTRFGKPPKMIRSDQGGEYRATELVRFLKDEGILQQFTTAYTPQQNGVAERKNRSLVEMARCMIIDAGMHYRYWAEAVSTANFLQNMLPTKPIQLTPYEMWCGEKPDFGMMQIFGSEAYVFVPKEKRTKLESKAVKMTFVGYSSQHKAWRFIDTKTNKIVFSRDARFLPTKENPDSSTPDAPEDHVVEELPPVSVPATTESHMDRPPDGFASDEEDFYGYEEEDFHGYEDEPTMYEDACNSGENVSEHGDESDVVQEEFGEIEEEQSSGDLRRSNRTNKGVPPDRFSASSRFARPQSSEPRSYKQATTGTESAQWITAMKDELISHRENKTWDVVKLPPGKKIIGCRWIYKRKLDEHGRLSSYKARLVAQGHKQRFGLDYDEIFAPVAKQVTFRMLLTIASRRNMLVKHVDVKTAYLNGDLKETVYMKIPPGVAAEPNEVCLLRKSLYGLKQSARMWNRKLDETLRQMGFKPAEADPCLYVRWRNKKLTFILVYVDDMLICTSTQEEYEEILEALNSKFQMTALGDVKQFLGIQVTKTENGYCLNQQAYINRMVASFGLDDAKGSRIPMDPGYIQLKEEVERLPNNDKYQSLVGGLLYVSVHTRPDIGISASILGRRVSNPTVADWTEAKRTLRYLKATSGLQLQLGGDAGDLEGFADADWAGNVLDRKSNSGYLFRFGGGLISWCARKQPCVALSSTEAEYISLSECCQELMWLKKLMKDFGESVKKPICIFEDNQSCIKQLSQAKTIGKRSKHIDTKYHFVKDLFEQEQIDVTYCPSEDMLADILTKPLSRVKLEILRDRIGLRSARDEEE